MANIFVLIYYCLTAVYFEIGSAARIATIDLIGMQTLKTIDEDSVKHGLQNTNQHQDLLTAYQKTFRAEPGYERRQLRLFWFLSCMSFCAIATMIVLLSYRWFGPEAMRTDGKMSVPEDDVATDSSDSDMEEEAMVSKTSSRITGMSLIKYPIKLSGKSAREKRLRRAFKHQWLIESSGEQVGNCAAVFLCVMSGFIVLRLFRRYKGFRHVTFSTDAEYGDYVAANVVEIVACVFALALAFHSMRQKTNIFYWPAFLFFCFYVMAGNLPPFELSCSELHYNVAHAENVNWLVKQADETKDCTLQGVTAQQSLLCAILVLPFLVPRQKMLSRFAFAWILIYILWTWLYHYITSESTILTPAQHLCRFGVLSFAMGIAVVKKFYLEKSQRNIFVHQKRSKDAVKRMFHYFQYMVPEHVIVPMITNPSAAVAEKVNKVSISRVVSYLV